MRYNRTQLEQNEDQALAPYAIRSKNTHGRLYPEAEADYRTCYQRDRDRILHTTAFRRLEYKTQVFINYEGDYYRTRLTHTLEVAQIGRSLAIALGGNPDLTEAICLAHDLGHPAFGHSGEAALARLMRDSGGFEHNKQSLRIVTRLERRYDAFPGLNLSWETLEGMVKHETEYDRTDAKDFNPELRGHLEAQIANVADDLACTAHDREDVLRSGMIDTDMLTSSDLWQIATRRIGWSGGRLSDLERHCIIRELIGMEVNDLIEATDGRLNENTLRSVEQIQTLAFNVVGFSQTMVSRNRQLKDFLFNNLYRHPRVVRMAVKAERILSDLFNAYRAEPNILPYHVQAGIAENGLERTLCDYLAGMTDRYAIDEYQRLFDPAILP